MTESLSNSQHKLSVVSEDTLEDVSTKQSFHYTYTSPRSPAYFLPSLQTTNPSTFDPTTTNFGLISQPYNSDASLPPFLHHGDKPIAPTDWQRFAHHLATLNDDAPENVSMHILFLSRHGQGYHNLAQSYYGTDAWDCYWSALDGDPESNITWADAHLSTLGQQQAREQSTFWERQIMRERMPVPGKWFVSPMDRALNTAGITFGALGEKKVLGEGRGWKPVVKEFLRETNGVHTCDRRSARSAIVRRYPGCVIEKSFAEEDELWDPVYRETDEAHTYRAKVLFDNILEGLGKESEDGRYLSLTAHGGMINAILRAVGHREFQVRVGSAIAVLVRAERIQGARKAGDFEQGQTKPDCVDDPLKAGLPGYKSLKEYVDSVEASVDD